VKQILMKNLTFNSTYLIGILLASIIRIIYTRTFRKNKNTKNYSTNIDKILITLPGLGMFLLPLIHIFSSWLSFADFRLSDNFALIGVFLFISSLILLWRSHIDLAKNWTPLLQIQKNQNLVSRGIFRFIRHPMYTAHLLWGIAQPFLLPNWIAGFSTLVFLIVAYIYRIPREEEMLSEFFGERYEVYKAKTGRLFPKFQ
jgi:protein-S-isoprenylcysteine O-methyltransferase Ste14